MISRNDRRQTYDITDAGAGQEYYWNYSTTAVAIKWAVIGAIILFILLWFVGGYYHAQRRIRQGKRPLAYHSFLIHRRQRAQFFPQPDSSHYNPQQGVYRPQEFPLQDYRPPPPAYNAEHYAPPQYQPPEGASKVNPEQDYTAPPQSGPSGDIERGESSHAAVTPSVDLNHEHTGLGSPESHVEVPQQESPRLSLTARINPLDYGATQRRA